MKRAAESPEERTLRYHDRRFLARRRSTLWNGWMLIFFSPFLFIICAGKGIEEFGPVRGTLAGCVAGAIFLTPGILAVRWSKRTRRPAWLERLRFRVSRDTHERNERE